MLLNILHIKILQDCQYVSNTQRDTENINVIVIKMLLLILSILSPRMCLFEHCY
jgi:hypothetical protein